jgi:uncharacterized protein YndB with AHSA1/START domain
LIEAGKSLISYLPTVERLRLAAILSADPGTIFDAWVSGELHTEMTGANATSEATKGGAFTAWNGYITGKHVELERGKRIVQSWRTTEFPGAAPDSTVEIRLSKVKKGTRISLLQSDIPDGQSDMYAEGWVQYYFDPMTRYFATRPTSEPEKAPGQRAKPSTSRSKPRAPAKKKAKKKTAKKTSPARKRAPKARRKKTTRKKK